MFRSKHPKLRESRQKTPAAAFRAGNAKKREPRKNPGLSAFGIKGTEVHVLKGSPPLAYYFKSSSVKAVPSLKRLEAMDERSVEASPLTSCSATSSPTLGPCMSP